MKIAPGGPEIGLGSRIEFIKWLKCRHCTCFDSKLNLPVETSFHQIGRVEF